MDRKDFPSTEAELRAEPVYGPILFPPDGSGTLDIDQLAKEMGDLMMVKSVADRTVYDYTGGILSGTTRLGGSIYTYEGIRDAATMAYENEKERSEHRRLPCDT